MIVRRIVLFLLLITVPFQAAIGSTGFVCGHGTRHADVDAASVHSPHAHEHDRIAHVHGDSHPGAGHVHAGDIGNDAGSCSLCSECSFSAAPASDSAVDAPAPPTALRVSSYVDPAALRYAGDGLFRPPRTIRS